MYVHRSLRPKCNPRVSANATPLTSGDSDAIQRPLPQCERASAGHARTWACLDEYSALHV
jgi:hypothetical protein